MPSSKSPLPPGPPSRLSRCRTWLVPSMFKTVHSSMFSSTVSATEVHRRSTESPSHDASDRRVRRCQQDLVCQQRSVALVSRRAIEDMPHPKGHLMMLPHRETSGSQGKVSRVLTRTPPLRPPCRPGRASRGQGEEHFRHTDMGSRMIAVCPSFTNRTRKHAPRCLPPRTAPIHPITTTPPTPARSTPPFSPLIV